MIGSLMQDVLLWLIGLSGCLEGRLLIEVCSFLPRSRSISNSTTTEGFKYIQAFKVALCLVPCALWGGPGTTGG